MKEIFDQVLTEGFRDEFGTLVFSHTEIEIHLDEGCILEDSFTIDATPGSVTNGFITTSDVRMECKTEKFYGNHEEIHFCFHGENLEAGDVVKGYFIIVSNHGEYTLPFVVTVEHTIAETSVGPVKNLFHFTNLAKSDWTEALRFFYSCEFERLLCGQDRQYMECYRGLSHSSLNEQHMEEFLIQINKKQPVEYVVSEDNIELKMDSSDVGSGEFEKEIRIGRNGWGYTSLNIECDGNFLFSEKSVLSDDDFLGNQCTLPVYIDATCLREGNNFGRVLLYNCYVSLEINVSVRVDNVSEGRQVYFHRKHAQVELMELYEAFRMKQISTAVWLKDSKQIVEKLLRYDEEDIGANLFKAQLLITEERINEAKWFLEHAKDLLDESEEDDWELYSYYLYLNTLMQRDEAYVDKIAEQVGRIYKREYSSWKIAWLLLFLSEEFSKSPTQKWQFLEEQFENGCTSLVIYIEALILLNNHPTLLRELGAFELQILHYGVKNNALSKEVMNQLLYLCHKVRDYNGLLCKILEDLYDKTNENLLLQEICTLLIKGAQTGKNCFKWYSLGVEQQLRITNLYEYYMMSVDLYKQIELPKIVILYFSYQSNLDYERLAYLYRYVLENKENLGEIYGHYEPRILKFVTEQIEKEHMNRHLAVLYTAVLQPEMVDERLAGPLLKLLFTHGIQVEDLRMRKAYVYYPDCLEVTQVTINDGKCFIPLYGHDYTIVLEDGFGNRFVKTANYDLEKMMSPGKLMAACVAFGQDIPQFQLYYYKNKFEHEALDKESAMLVYDLCISERVAPSLRRGLTMKLLQYYYEQDEMDALDAILDEASLDEFTISDRATLIKYLVLRGQYEYACRWLEYYDPYFVDINTLVRLVSAQTNANQTDERKILTAISVYVFRKGKYNNAVLEYLCKYFTGSTKELRDIWKTSVNFGTDGYEIAEKILMQIMYSGGFVGEQTEIFRYYVSKGAKQEVEAAFLNQCAYDYFVNERLMDEYVFSRIRQAYQRDEKVEEICKLAFLKYYAENKEEINDLCLPVIEEWLKEMMAARIHFNFFRELPCDEAILKEMADKTIIEYRARPGSRARIHYMILHDNGEAQDYQCDYMKDVYGGVFFKDFVLFFGETLQYYIMEENGDTEQLTKSGNVSHNDTSMDVGNSRFELINEMVIGKNLKDYDAMEDALEKYYKQEFFNEHLFRMK